MNDIQKEIDPLLEGEEKATNFVTELYNQVLGREPDAMGLRGKVRQLLSGNLTPGQLVKIFIDSPEARGRIFWDIWETRTSIYHMDITKDFDTVQQLFNKTAQYWRKAGFDENEVYYSVISSDEMKKKLSEKDIRAFYASGAQFIDFCIHQLKAQGITDFHDLTCLDIGCGIGRLSFNASMYFKKVYAVDFSEGHLELLTKNTEIFPALHKNNITTVYLKDLADAKRLPKEVDFIYSLISLQHNTPPVIAFMVKQLLGSLKKGGFACLHIPIHHPFYSFSEQEYLSSDKSGNGIEMHILPRENIREIARESGATIIDSFGYGGTRGIYSEVFLLQSDSMRTETDAELSSSSSGGS